MRYRLEPVRGVRDRAAQGARSELAGAVGAARITEADLVRAAERTHVAEERVRAARAARAGLSTVGQPPAAAPNGGAVRTTAAAIARADRYVARCLHALAQARIEEHAAREVHAGRLETVDAQRAKLATARAEKQAIDNHFAAWREQQRKLADRRSEE